MLIDLKGQYFKFRQMLFDTKSTNYFHIIKRFLLNRTERSTYSLNLKALRICFLLYLYILLFYFTRAMIYNTLKISKILIDYSNIIYDKDQLKKTNREMCFFKNQGVLPFFRNSPNGCDFKRIYLSKYKNCHLGLSFLTDRSEMVEFEKNRFLATIYSFANVFSSILIHQTGFKYWISPEQFNLSLMHLIRNSLNKEIKKTMKLYILRSLESNLYEFCFKRTIDLYRYFYHDINENIHESLKSIIDQNTKFVAGDLNSYKSIFLMLFGIEIGLLIIFIFCKLSDQFRIRSRIKYYLKIMNSIIKRSIKSFRKYLNRRFAKKEIEKSEQVLNQFSNE